MLEPLRRMKQRLLGMVVRGVVTLVNDAVAGQQLQARLLAGETRDMLQRVQNYGFSSVPMPGAYPIVVVCPGGDRAQALVLAADDVRHRPTGGEPGDVLVYDKRGNKLRLHDGGVEITAATDLAITVAGDAAISVEGAATVEVAGNLEAEVGGNATIDVTGNATLETGGQLNLGGVGGQPVARVGDDVDFFALKIVSGSAKVKAV